MCMDVTEHAYCLIRSCTGLCDSTEGIAVSFNVIVPKLHWQWDDESSLHLRFGDFRLGMWMINLGKFVVK